MTQSKKKFSKGAFRMQDLKNVEREGEFSPFLRFCIGASLLIFTACSGLAILSVALPWERLLP